ncbi:MAG: hypothetical protein Q9166_001221 [cf. Caloplaca sp. 2 TL-2023]
MPNFNYNPQTKAPTSGTILFYNGPVDKPKALEDFTAIPVESGSAKVQNYSQFTATTSGYAPLALIFVNWSNAKDDALVKSYTDRVLASNDRQTKARGLYYPWLFLNDAGVTQDPISTYGYGASLPRMKAVSRKYDPQGFFRRTCRGFSLGMSCTDTDRVWLSS